MWILADAPGVQATATVVALIVMTLGMLFIFRSNSTGT